MKPHSQHLPLLRILVISALIAFGANARGQLHWYYYPFVEYYCDVINLQYSVVLADKDTPSGSYAVPIYKNGGTIQWVQFTVNDDRSISGLSWWNPNDPIESLSDGTVKISTDGKLYNRVNGSVVGTVDAGDFGTWSWTQGDCCPSPTGFNVPIILPIGAKCRKPEGTAGLVSLGLGSLDLQIGQGTSSDGKGTGALEVRSPVPFAWLSTPRALIPPATAATVITDTNGPRQVLTAQVLADIVTNDQYQYQISLYKASDAGTQGGDGLFHPSAGAFKTISIQNPDASISNYNRLWVTEVEGSTSNLFAYSYDSSTSSWQLQAPGNLQKKVLSTTYSSDMSQRTELLSIYTPGSPDVLVYREQTRYQGTTSELPLERVIDPSGLRLTNTWQYDANYRLTQKTQWDGYWEAYSYDSQLREVKRVYASRNATNGSPDNLCRVITNSYSSTPPNVTTIELLQGQEVSRTYTALYAASNCVTTYRCQTPGASWNDPGNLVSYVVRNSASQPLISREADGTATFYGYVTNADNSVVTTSTNGAANASGNGISEGTKTIVVTGPFGEMVSNIVVNFTASAEGPLLAQDGYSYADSDYARTSPTVSHLDGTQTLEANGCCGTPSLGNTVDKDGTTTYYVYDALKRRVSSTLNGIISSNIFDAYGNVLTALRVGTDSSVITNRQSGFDLAGRPVWETNASHSGTVYTYGFDSEGQLVKTTTFQDGGTRIETLFRDGSLQSLTGTALFPIQYDYGVDSNGAFTLATKLDAGGGTNEWTRTYKDMLGRQYLQVYSGATNFPASTSYFNSKGQLANQVDPDGVSTLYTYNSKGQQACSVLDWNRDYNIDFAGNDRITLTTNDVVNDYSTNVRRTRTYAWSSNGTDSSALISTSETSTDGLRSWNTVWNNGAAVTSQSIVVYAGSGNRYQTNVAPDNSFSVSAFQYGRLASVARYDANGAQIGQTLYGYDAHGRQNSVTDARTGTTTDFFNDADQISGVVTPARAVGQSAETTTNYFDSMGRIFATTLPDNTSVTNSFNPNGLLVLTYGSRTYPVGYCYDAQGRLTYMTNWSDFAGRIGARVTTWNYDPYRGFLTAKTYDNGNNARPAYSYTPGGRLLTRLWARGTSTTYSYNPAGELSGVTYNDGTTPNLSYGYDRRGRQTSITNGATVCFLTLNDAGNILAETYSGTGPLSGISITNGYDSLLRRTNYAVLANENCLSLVNEGYDASSRLASISDGINSSAYTYIANSPLVGQICFSNYGILRMVTTKSYDNLNHLTSTGTTNALGSALDLYAYTYNSANQRTGMTNLDNSYWVYQYDTLGQVTSGVKYWSDGTPVAGQQFGYAFDSIGNRQGTTAGGDQSGANLPSASYGGNNLNQYTNRTVPNAVDIIGSATNSATVTVNGQASYRNNDYYRAQLGIDNSAGPVFQSVSNVAALTLDTNTISTNIIGNVFLPQSPENFSYDADGNLTGDGRWTYFWDGENRLIAMTNNANVPDAAKMTLAFAYDHLGRRVGKTVCNYNPSTLRYECNLQNCFIYDGWNLQTELNATNDAVIRSFVWGMDLSGSVQGAGGIGGLLWTFQPEVGNTRAFICYDGNGNATGLIYSPDSSVVGQYEYGPFGEVIRATGPMAKANSFRFSTKYQDDETDLLYYGYRYCNPSTGRWISRDPSGEKGERNLYGFVANDPVRKVDKLGLVTGSFVVEHSNPQIEDGRVGWSIRLAWHPPSSWAINCPCKSAVWIQHYNFSSRMYSTGWSLDWSSWNYQGNATLWANGRWPRGQSLDISEMWDDPYASGLVLALSPKITFEAESCVQCLTGPDTGKIYGCYDWGYRVVDNDLRGGAYSGPYDGPKKPSLGLGFPAPVP